jgi:hypothetical protein
MSRQDTNSKIIKVIKYSYKPSSIAITKSFEFFRDILQELYRVAIGFL